MMFSVAETGRFRPECGQMVGFFGVASFTDRTASSDSTSIDHSDHRRSEESE